MARSSIFAWVAAFVLLGPTTATARPPVMGFRAGWSTARLHGSFGDEMGPHYRQDLTASFYTKLRVRSLVSFQPEIAWVSKGGRGNFQITSFDASATAFDLHLENRFSYVEMPLLIRLDIPTRGSLQPYMVAGPSPAWRIGDGSTTVEISQSTGSVRAKPAGQIFEDVGTLASPLRTRSFDLGLVGAVGVWFGRGPARLGLEARYEHGLLDVHPADSAEMRNGAFAVTSAIEFR